MSATRAILIVVVSWATIACDSPETTARQLQEIRTWSVQSNCIVHNYGDHVVAGENDIEYWVTCKWDKQNIPKPLTLREITEATLLVSMFIGGLAWMLVWWVRQ